MTMSNEAEVVDEPTTLPAVQQAELSSQSVALADAYRSAGTLAVKPEQGAILLAPVDESQVQIRPDGIIYLPWSFYARTLNKAFGPMGWAPMRLGTEKKDEKNNIMVRVALVA